ncbi:MAG: prepilin-type N-terminal cleavage/methylation domain-containing protein [Candidatus Omnitrophica bacterium]|nr:prepilin-type N-terminal cleavage/methylation domain-containing protein [Candidatus Omnitrophota bacterium]
MRKSFTLIELIVVIAIIAILAAIIVPNAFKAIEKAKVTEAIADFKTLKTAMYSMYGDTRKWGIENHEDNLAAYPQHGFVFVNNPNVVPYDPRFTELVDDPNSDADPNNDMPGWDGPYVERLKGKTPWKGSYAIQAWRCDDETGGFDSNARDIWLEFEDICYEGPRTNTACPVPDSVALKIDTAVDDGDVRRGEFRVCDDENNWCYCTGNDSLWVIVHNAG